MAVGDIYQVKFYQHYLGELMLNVFYYEQYGGSYSTGAQDLCTGIQGSGGWLDDWALFQLEDVTYEKIQVVNGMDNADQFEDFTLSKAGGDILTEDAVGAPSLLAMGFRSNRAGIGSRYSYKRIGGFPTYFLEDNTWGGTALGIAAEIATALAATFEANGRNFRPVQVTGGFKLGVTPTKSFNITSWTPMTTPSTQTTRKAGRGA